MKRQALRIPTKVAEALLHRIDRYSLGAAAAGVGMMALTPPAEAKIIYHATHVVLGYRGVGVYHLDLNRDGVDDITFSTDHNDCTSGCFAVLRASVPAENQLRGKPDGLGFFSVNALHSGAKIGNTGMNECHRSSDCGLAGNGTGLYGPYGEWLNVKNRYLGLKFKIGNKTHFGWARLSVAITPTQVNAKLTGYAYETIPNKAIVAGRTQDSHEFRGSLGRLALGRK